VAFPVEGHKEALAYASVSAVKNCLNYFEGLLTKLWWRGVVQFFIPVYSVPPELQVVTLYCWVT